MSANGRAPTGGAAGPEGNDLTSSAIASANSHPDLHSQCRAFLARAAALDLLVELGEYDAIAAFDQLRPAFAEIACGCARQMLRACEESDRKLREHRLMDWRWGCRQ
jgi:hypothetical protein